VVLHDQAPGLLWLDSHVFWFVLSDLGHGAAPVATVA